MRLNKVNVFVILILYNVDYMFNFFLYYDKIVILYNFFKMMILYGIVCVNYILFICKFLIIRVFFFMKLVFINVFVCYCF